MAETITLAGADGFEFSAYHEQAFTPHKGGVIVIQEIFGIDRHVRADVERWAKMGYEAIAPSLFDRRVKDYIAPHDAAGIEAGRAHAMATPLDQALGDIAACRDFLAKHGGKVHVVGYCYGGSLAWLSAAKVEGLAASSSYYGSLVQANAALQTGLQASDNAVKQSMQTYDAAIKQAMQGVDTVFHLAALIAIPYSYSAPESFVDTNVKGTLHLQTLDRHPSQ